MRRDVERLAVLDSLNRLGWKFLGQQAGHLSLVRPDDDWFPGLHQIKSELGRGLALVKEKEGRPVREQAETFNLQSSFGL